MVAWSRIYFDIGAAAMTKNSFVTQAVVWVGFALMILSLFFDQSKAVFAIGYTTLWFGGIQSYYGTVLEIQGKSQLAYSLAGVPLSLGMVYISYLSLWYALASWPSIAIALFAVLAIQVVVTLVAFRIWKRKNIAA